IAGSNAVTLSVSGSTSGLSNGDIVYLSSPGVSVDGISALELTGYFTISNLTSTTFDIGTATTALAGGSQAPIGTPTALPPYSSMDAYSNGRTGDDGIITADLSGNLTAPFYNISLEVGVDDGTGNI